MTPRTAAASSSTGSGWSVRMVSAAGLKSTPSPNQDAYSFTHLRSDWSVCMVCDGHGDSGEVLAERLARSLPQLQAGATVALPCVSEAGEAWAAHTGDSRVVLADLARGVSVFHTEDHKGHDPREYARLKAAGAQTITKRYEDGEVPSRIYVPRTGVPGPAMSRSLGDDCPKKYGVIAEPDVHEVSALWSDCLVPLAVLASDGLWDAVSIDEAVEALAARHSSGLSVGIGAEALTRRAQHLWIEMKGDYCDDVTIALFGPETSCVGKTQVSVDAPDPRCARPLMLARVSVTGERRCKLPAVCGYDCIDSRIRGEVLSRKLSSGAGSSV